MIKYEKKNLFDMKPPAILTHAVNCQGVMGSGIAREFKQRFPKAFQAYYRDCTQNGARMLSKARIYPTEVAGLFMGCLFTSVNYGDKVDAPAKIVKSTTTAVMELLIQRELLFTPLEYEKTKIFSNKFNSGLFNVPWPKTAAVIEEQMVAYHGDRPRTKNFVWTVCDPF